MQHKTTITRKTALILLLVFVFPLTYQNLHLLHHVKSPHHSSPNSGTAISLPGAGNCPICSYKFTTCNLPEMPRHFDFVSYIAATIQEIPLNLHICFSGTHIPLRGPPLVS